MSPDPNRTKAAVDALRGVYAKKEPKAQAKPEGRRLVTIQRGQDGELRLTWDEYEGRPFLSLRLWQRTEDGQAIPTKKGLSIRLRELPELVEGLVQACEAAQAHLEREGTHG